MRVEVNLIVSLQEAKFPCAECNFVSISEEALMQHKATSHEAEGFPCDLSNHQAGVSFLVARFLYYWIQKNILGSEICIFVLVN